MTDEEAGQILSDPLPGNRRLQGYKKLTNKNSKKQR